MWKVLPSKIEDDVVYCVSDGKHWICECQHEADALLIAQLLNENPQGSMHSKILQAPEGWDRIDTDVS